MNPTISDSSATYKERVAAFWAWFAPLAGHYAGLLQTNQFDSDTDPIAERVQSLHPNLGWELGWDSKAARGTLTVTGQGNKHLQYLADYCARRAPELPGWQFFGMKQPEESRAVLQYKGSRITADEIWIVPELNEENEVIDLTIGPLEWTELGSGDEASILFLMLDALLGEHGAESWIGSLQFTSERLKEAIPLSELPGFLKETQEQTGWEKAPFGEASGVYELRMPLPFPRGDARIGRTTHYALIRDYLEADGELKDPLDGSGAEYLFLSIPATNFSEGNEAMERGEIEDILEEQLGPDNGRVFGGAFGLDYAYVDLLIYDGERSRRLIREALEPLPIAKGSRLCSFTV